jgi:hypothetical protein
LAAIACSVVGRAFSSLTCSSQKGGNREELPPPNA